ncbi:class I SAM-dependent methyltransferase [Sneathiella sp.]|uniref:class I SAM-dependent methyltransferase n=1 Tax=Sneathiella sp. TaxID=1964365 RepID=UPI003569CA0C
MNDTSTHASFTGSIPENYNTYLGPLLFEFSGADLARRINTTVSHPAKVLEVACGTGISTRHLAEVLPIGTEILATDLNEAMLNHASSVNANLPGVTYSQANALDLPFDDASFDAVVCSFGIMFFPDKSLGMKEMTRVLKPGGVLALNVWDAFDQNLSVGVVDRVIKRFFESNPPRFLEIPFGTVDEESGRGLFHDAGYDAVDVAHVSEVLEVKDYSLPARGLITGNPTIIEVEQRAAVGVEEIIAAAEKALADEFGPTPAKLSFQAIVFLAKKPEN